MASRFGLAVLKLREATYVLPIQSKCHIRTCVHCMPRLFGPLIGLRPTQPLQFFMLIHVVFVDFLSEAGVRHGGVQSAL